MSFRANGGDTGLENGAAAISRADILEEITAICQPLTPVREDEVTIGACAARWGCGVSTAQTVLDRQVEAGKLTKRKALNPETGRECYAYSVA